MEPRRRVRGWLLVAATAAILGTALGRDSGIRDAATGEAVPGVSLILPAGYVALSPLSRALDALSLLSTSQHIALVASVALCFVLWRAATARRHRPVRVVRELGLAGTVLGAMAASYGAAAALPRPMAALQAAGDDVVRIDFHSHTSASHDARAAFTAERNRAWHRASGFDVAYVSDHRTYDGAASAALSNPQRSGDGVTLLSSLEARYRGIYTIVLRLTAADRHLVDDKQHLMPGVTRSGREPVSIAVIPGLLDRDVQREAVVAPPRLRAIEFVNGSPQALEQRAREGAMLRARAESLGIALVTGTNAHGWGYVAPGWTLLNLPGWRALSSDSLGAAIESALRRGDRFLAVERSRFHGEDGGIRLALTAGDVLFGTLTHLSTAERAAWLLWLWGPGAVGLLASRRGARQRRDAAATVSPG